MWRGREERPREVERGRIRVAMAVGAGKNGSRISFVCCELF